MSNDPLFIALQRSSMLTPEQVDYAEKCFDAFPNDREQLAAHLRNADILTAYQHRKIQLGRLQELLFGKYLILDKIGEGGMGKVYRAVDTTMGHLAALKVVRPSLLANKTVLKRYRREARTIAALDHPNIVHLFDADEVNGRHYLAMEYVDGSDLARLVKENGPLSSGEACEYIRQAALGLHHAHEKGFVHRDIKPSNLLVYGERALPGSGGQATLKILDMGLVRCLDDEDGSLAALTSDNAVVGTPDYMSPEQAHDSRGVDGRTDLYSLGCALVFLLRGKPPFPEHSTIGKLLAHQRNPIPDICAADPSIPLGLGEIVFRLLAKRKEERFATGLELAEALAEFIPARNLDSPTPVSPLRRWSNVGSRGGVSTATPVRMTLGHSTPVPVHEIPKPRIAKPSSGSIHLDNNDDGNFIRTQTPASGTIPLWATAMLATVAILGPLLLFAMIFKPDKAPSNVPTTPKAALHGVR